MRITLETVRGTIREPFGRDCFVASFIKSIEADDSCPTACIDADGRMLYNPKFTENYLQDPQSLFCIIVHEMCHCVFRHSVHGGGRLENLGEDALINAFITRAFPVTSDNGRLFREFYGAESIEGLLRPDSALRLSRFGPLYNQLYSDSREITSGEVIQALRVLLPEESNNDAVVLLGSHDNQSGGPSAHAIEGIAEDLGRALDQNEAAGKGGSLVKLFKKRIASAVAIKRALLRRYTTSRRLDNFVEPLREHRMGVSPVPISPSKRELIMLHAGMMPPHFRRPMTTEKTTRKGLAIYLDVSGSVQEYLPRILGILARLEDVLTGIFLFSTEVQEIPFKQLLAGNISTTFGTSFDCVADSVIERSFERAVILTDGHASLTAEKKDALKKGRVNLLTILFGGSSDCEPLAPFGQVVQLDQVVG
jgi:hypothetical protein